MLHQAASGEGGFRGHYFMLRFVTLTPPQTEPCRQQPAIGGMDACEKRHMYEEQLCEMRHPLYPSSGFGLELK